MSFKELLMLSALVLCSLGVTAQCVSRSKKPSLGREAKNAYRALTDPKKSFSEKQVDEMVNKIRKYQLRKPGTYSFTLAGKDMDWLMKLKETPSLFRCWETPELKRVLEKSKGGPSKTFLEGNYNTLFDLCNQEATDKFESFLHRNPGEARLISDYMAAMKKVKSKDSETTPKPLGAALAEMKSARADLNLLPDSELWWQLNKACNLFLREGLGLAMPSELKNTAQPVDRPLHKSRALRSWKEINNLLSNSSRRLSQRCARKQIFLFRRREEIA